MADSEQHSLAAEREATSRGRCMCVSVSAASYGLPLENVQEVIGLRPITRVFHAPDALAGIINLRGEVLPVLDLARLLGAAASQRSSADARIVVVREPSGAKRRAGLRVDSLVGLLDVPAHGLAVPPGSLHSALRALVVGVIPATPPCAVLDITSLLAAPELSALAGSPAS